MVNAVSDFQQTLLKDESNHHNTDAPSCNKMIVKQILGCVRTV